jgi:hypothetical protein
MLYILGLLSPQFLLKNVLFTIYILFVIYAPFAKKVLSVDSE